MKLKNILKELNLEYSYINSYSHKNVRTVFTKMAKKFNLNYSLN